MLLVARIFVVCGCWIVGGWNSLSVAIVWGCITTILVNHCQLRITQDMFEEEVERRVVGGVEDRLEERLEDVA